MRRRRQRRKALRWLHQLGAERREQVIVAHLRTKFERVEVRHRTGGWIEVLGRDNGQRFVVRCSLRWRQLEAIDVQITGALRDAQQAHGAAVVNLGSVGIGAELASQQLGVKIFDRSDLALQLYEGVGA